MVRESSKRSAGKQNFWERGNISTEAILKSPHSRSHWPL